MFRFEDATQPLRHAGDVTRPTVKFVRHSSSDLSESWMGPPWKTRQGRQAEWRSEACRLSIHAAFPPSDCNDAKSDPDPAARSRGPDGRRRCDPEVARARLPEAVHQGLAARQATAGPSPWRLTDRHRALLLKVPDEGWIEGARLDARSLDVMVRRGWIQHVHSDPLGRQRHGGFQRTHAARAALAAATPPP